MKIDLIAIEEKAKEIAINQGRLANSPFSIDQKGHLTLCAAACIAYAGHDIYHGKAAADKLFDQLKKTPEDDFGLENAFRDLGLSAQLCAKIRAENDGMPTHSRLPWFTESNFLSPHFS
jgi:hypothetical protein